ncbi:MAG: hypothetical protein ABIH39_03720 [Candidatus Margulisiibacteriota bacterium]
MDSAKYEREAKTKELLLKLDKVQLYISRAERRIEAHEKSIEKIINARLSEKSLMEKALGVNSDISRSI